MEKNNDHRAARKQIMSGPASRSARLKRQDVRNRDEKRMSRQSFGEWIRRREARIQEESRPGR